MLDRMLRVTNEAWKKEQSQIVSALKQRGLILSGDGAVIAQATMQNISLNQFSIKV